MNPEKKGKPELSDTPIVDLTMDDSDDSKELPQSNDAEITITKEVFPKKQKEDSPASHGFRAESRFSTCHEEIARLDDITSVRSSITGLQDAESMCLASALKTELKKNMWMLKTDAWRMSKENVTDTTSMPGSPWSRQQTRGTCANDETLGTIVGRISNATADTSIKTVKECRENLHGGRSEGKPSRERRVEQSCGTSFKKPVKMEKDTMAGGIQINHEDTSLKVNMEILDVGRRMLRFQKFKIPSSTGEATEEEIMSAKFTPAEDVKPDVSSNTGSPVSSAIPTTKKPRLRATSLPTEQTSTQEISTSSSSSVCGQDVLSAVAVPSINPPASSFKRKTGSKSTKEGDLPMSKVVHKSVGENEIKRPKKMAKEDQELVRSMSKAVLSKALWERCEETADLKTDKAAIRNIAIQVEESLFLVSGKVDDGYMVKYKDIVKNLKDTDKFLFRQIATRKITSNDLVNMTSEELADVDMAAWQETKLRLMLNAARKGKVSLKDISEADGTQTDERLKAVKKPDKECHDGVKTLPIATVPSFPLDSNQDTTPGHRVNGDATLLTVDVKKKQSENYRNQRTKSSYYAENKNTFNKPRYHHSSASKDELQKPSERVDIMKKPDSSDQSISSLSACEEVSKSVSDNWMIEKVNALHGTDHVAHSKIAGPSRVETINAGSRINERKPLAKQFCLTKRAFARPASLQKNEVPNQTSDAERNSETKWSAEAAFREAMIPYSGPPNRLNYSSLDVKPPVGGESSSYPRLIKISGITDRTPPADPRLRASTSRSEMKPSKVINIPLLNEQSSSINLQESPSKIWRSWN